jgi:exonuclease VII large subunit
MAASNISPTPSEALATAARDKRQETEKVHRLALTLSLNRDRQTLLWYAQDLEREAEVLERQAKQADSTRSRTP